MRLFSSLQGLTVKLQRQSKDILDAYDQVMDIQLELELLKCNLEEEFHLWFQEITKHAESLNVSVTIPRVHASQID